MKKMKKFHKNILFFCCNFILLFFSCFSLARAPFMQDNSSLAPMLQNVLPGIVNIATRGELPPLSIPILDDLKQKHDVKISPKFEELGSGVIVDADKGYVITNAHVVKDAKVISVTLNDGRVFPAKVVGADNDADIAVIQINAKRLYQLKFGDSDKLKVGDFVSAIGTPFGLQQTVTSGVVSGLDRSNLGIEGYENFIQTDAPINPGNSGGALINMQGEVIGINTAIFTSSPIGGNIGVGFAIPSNMAKSVMEQLIKYGKVEHSVIGIVVQNLTPSLAEAMHLTKPDGALVSEVMPETPAAQAGIKSKDVILTINNSNIRNAAQVSNTVSVIRPDSKITLRVLRDNKELTLTATTASKDKLTEAGKNAPKSLLDGLRLMDFNQLINNEGIKGVEILYVDDASVAYSNGVRRGDVIVSAANQPVATIEDLRRIARENPRQLLLETKRAGEASLFIVLEQ
jgi:serine protease Do